MKKASSFTLALFLFLMIRTEAQTWNLVWSDEFTNATINTANWVFETGGGGWGNAELENYTNRAVNATVSNGNLLIIGKKESYGGSNYTSARMKTQGLQSWTYGKVEARIKIPTGKGLWPAFWMLGNNISTVNWPTCGEIDIMEHINTDNKDYGTMHWYNAGNASYGGDTALPTGVTQYHIYSVEWDSLAIKWLVDGKQYWIGNIANNINNTNAFHKPFFILLNMAIGGQWPGNPDGTTVFPDTMFVDYVRVYQQQAATSVNNNLSLENKIHVFPNPATETSILSIDGAQNGEYQVEIHDLLGKTCFQKNISIANNENITMPLSLDDLKPGIYFLSVRDNEMSTCLKLVKQ
ncbi:MAG: family 16 glycosylhydrolase [Bacteroidia bacterium]